MAHTTRDRGTRDGGTAGCTAATAGLSKMMPCYRRGSADLTRASRDQDPGTDRGRQRRSQPPTRAKTVQRRHCPPFSSAVRAVSRTTRGARHTSGKGYTPPRLRLVSPLVHGHTPNIPCKPWSHRCACPRLSVMWLCVAHRGYMWLWAESEVISDGRVQLTGWVATLGPFTRPTGLAQAQAEHWGALCQQDAS